MARQILCFLTKEMRRLANKELIKGADKKKMKKNQRREHENTSKKELTKRR